GLQLSKQGEGGRPERLFLFCLTAVNRCIQEMSARQDAAPHLQQKEQPVPNSGISMVNKEI
ncbi:hypothetical protein, partial [Bacteroides heparinolyticus]|uniref:hypothetical protein n=1 Tax=Prevotella heparinolytica TaxID=28113 RepID=UPI0035A1B8DC